MQHERRPGCGRHARRPAPERSVADAQLPLLPDAHETASLAADAWRQLAELTTDPRLAAVLRRGADTLNALTRKVEF
jgi:hypothetical protein